MIHFFYLKYLDSLEKYEKNISKKIILKLKTKKLVISFPTKSLKKKDNFKIKRTWFKNFLKEEKLQFKTFEIENEIFFLN